MGICLTLCADSNSLKDRSEGDEYGWVGWWKAVTAFSDCGITQSCGEEGDMSSLVVGDFLQVVVEGVRETPVNKVRLGIADVTLTVEFVLEVLESQSIVEHANYLALMAKRK
jgi:hypothetical protein